MDRVVSIAHGGLACVLFAGACSVIAAPLPREPMSLDDALSVAQTSNIDIKLANVAERNAAALRMVAGAAPTSSGPDFGCAIVSRP